MAELTLRLETDPATGHRRVVVSFESDADALPMEHEEEHRRLVDRLIEGGLIAADQRDSVKVERESAGGGAEESAAETGEAERRSLGEPG